MPNHSVLEIGRILSSSDSNLQMELNTSALQRDKALRLQRVSMSSGQSYVGTKFFSINPGHDGCCIGVRAGVPERYCHQIRGKLQKTSTSNEAACSSFAWKNSHPPRIEIKYLNYIIDKDGQRPNQAEIHSNG